jgi:hypothetical protein
MNNPVDVTINKKGGIEDIHDIEEIMVTQLRKDSIQLRKDSIETEQKMDEIIQDSGNINSQKGGVFILNENPEAVFYNFIRNSNIELLTPADSSSFGIVFKCKLKEGVVISDPKMNYWRLNTNSIINKGGLEKVTSLCIKLGFVSDVQHPEGIRLQLGNGSAYSEPKATTTEEEIFQEITIQSIIARTTNMNFESVCPYIVYSKIYEDNASITRFIEILVKNAVNNSIEIDTRKLMNGIRFTCNINKLKLSVIAMELLENTTSLLETINHGRYTLFENNHLKVCEGVFFMYFHELIRTAVESKVLLFDAKLENVLYNSTYPYYHESFKIREEDKSVMGRVILIDFGQTYLMTKEEASEFTYEKFTDVNENGDTVISYFKILLKIFLILCELVEAGAAEHFNTNHAIFVLLMGIIVNTSYNNSEISLVEMRDIIQDTFSKPRNRNRINNGLIATFNARQRMINNLLNGYIPIFGTEPDKRQEKITRLSNSVRRLNKSFLFDISKHYVTTAPAPASNSMIRDFINWVKRCNASINDVVDPSQPETGISINTVLDEIGIKNSDMERGGKRKTIRKHSNHRNRRNKQRTQTMNCKKKKRISRRFSKFK